MLLIALAMTIPAYFVSERQAPMFRATAKIALTQERLDSNFNAQSVDLSDRQMTVQLAVITGNAVETNARKIGARGIVTATSPVSSNVVFITSQRSDRNQAAVDANAYARSYIDYRQTQLQDSLDQAVKQLQQRISLLQKQITPLASLVRAASDAQRATVQASVLPEQAALEQVQASLQAQLGQLLVQRDLTTSSPDTTLVQTATAPTAAVSPKPIRDATLALILGLAFGISLAVLLETAHHRRIRVASVADPPYLPSEPAQGFSA